MAGERTAPPPALASIPESSYSDYRYEVIFRGYKWDPQVEDANTVSRHVALMDSATAAQLARWAEQLARETVLLEEVLLERPGLVKALGLPRRVVGALPRMRGYERGRHVRLMRFDFHPTADGWAVSEVNSDVPGGFAEASVLPAIAARHFPGYAPGAGVAARMLEAFRAKADPGLPIAFVHATAYSDDRQVMQYLSDHFAANGLRTQFAAPDHLRWDAGRARGIVEGQAGPLGGIVRFFPLEWLANLPRGAGWEGFLDSLTPSCNHPVAVFAQSKRLPLVWDGLGVDIPTWRRLLPETRDPRGVRAGDEAWVLKPALGRVGEGISIPEAAGQKELRRIRRAARLSPRDWVAQRRFRSLPLPTPEGEDRHLCVGAFTVDGRSAGFYGRVSPYPRIDAKARDIPILIAKDGAGNVR